MEIQQAKRIPEFHLMAYEGNGSNHKDVGNMPFMNGDILFP